LGYTELTVVVAEALESNYWNVGDHDQNLAVCLDIVAPKFEEAVKVCKENGTASILQNDPVFLQKHVLGLALFRVAFLPGSWIEHGRCSSSRELIRISRWPLPKERNCPNTYFRASSESCTTYTVVRWGWHISPWLDTMRRRQWRGNERGIIFRRTSVS
jgi:hypothetical protein